MTVGWLLLSVAGVVAIVWGADAFAEHLAAAATRLGVSAFALAVLLAGAEPEELATSVTASLRGAPVIAPGDVIGANVALCLMAVGATALVEGVRRVSDVEATQGRLGLVVVGFATAFEMVVLAWASARRGVTTAVMAGVVGSYTYNVTMTLGARDAGPSVDGHRSRPVARPVAGHGGVARPGRGPRRPPRLHRPGRGRGAAGRLPAVRRRGAPGRMTAIAGWRRPVDRPPGDQGVFEVGWVLL